MAKPYENGASKLRASFLETQNTAPRGREKKRKDADTLEDLKTFHATDIATRKGKRMAKIEAYAKKHKISVTKAMIALM